MIEKAKNYIQQSKKRKNIYVLCVFLSLTIIQSLLCLIPALSTASAMGAVIPVWLQITSYTVLAAHLFICIYCRILHLSNTLRGIFFYQLPPIIFFLIEMGMRIGGSAGPDSTALKLFDLWTVFSRPFSYLITPLIGMSEIYTKMICHIFFILITYFAYNGIKKSIAFQKKLEEMREFRKN